MFEKIIQSAARNKLPIICGLSFGICLAEGRWILSSIAFVCSLFILMDTR